MPGGKLNEGSEGLGIIAERFGIPGSPHGWLLPSMLCAAAPAVGKRSLLSCRRSKHSGSVLNPACPCCFFEAAEWQQELLMACYTCGCLSWSLLHRQWPSSAAERKNQRNCTSLAIKERTGPCGAALQSLLCWAALYTNKAEQQRQMQSTAGKTVHIHPLCVITEQLLRPPSGCWDAERPTQDPN
eukprot:1158004-Pelagomonas_calceolata.AAC.5